MRAKRFSHLKSGIARSRPQRYILLFAVAGGIHAGAAWAEGTDVFTPYLNYSANYDDNILRLHDSAAAQALLGTDKMSDTVQTATAGLKFDKLFSQQHVTADVSLGRAKYNEFSQFDHDNRTALADWNWHMGEHVDGHLGGSYSRTLAPFTEYLSLTPNVAAQQSNMRVHQREYVDAGWLLHPSWRVRGSFSHYDQRYDLDSQRANDGTLDTAEAGLDYLASTNSTVGVLVRKLRGKYAVAQDFGSFSVNNNYDQNEFKGKIVWQFSEKTQLQFIGGWVDRKYDDVSTRDSSGINTRLIGNWKATSKLALSVGAWREIGELNYLSANFGMTRGVNLGSVWNITDTLTLNGVLLHETRDYNGVAALGGTAASSHNDRYNSATIGLTYVPTLHLTLGTSLYHYYLDSTISQLSYSGNGILFNARYDF